MKRVFLIATIGTLLGTVVAARPASAPPPPSIGCHPTIIDQAAPVTKGPYYLANAFCPAGLNSSSSISAPSISPDERHFLVSGYDGLRVGAIGSTAAPRVIASRLTAGSLGYSKAPPFAWRDDSKAILGVRQDTMRPSGFALGPLSPIEIPNDREPRLLPSLKYTAGGLDGMLWVGGGGLALAEFGTKGSYYRPEHDDPTPTLAIVDGRRGKVLQAVPMPLSRGERPRALVGDIDARLDPQGKVFALFVLNGGRWFEWQQGKLPREMPLHPGPNGSWKFALSPDLKTVLIAHGLSASGILCEYLGAPADPNVRSAPHRGGPSPISGRSRPAAGSGVSPAPHMISRRLTIRRSVRMGATHSYRCRLARIRDGNRLRSSPWPTDMKFSGSTDP
ncbi:hypothetical protein [Sphingomonas sp.]|uniref:hypothetical protein n=1 Tax=Sphingomonas sp. TaxID=28214 RepID=UPI0025E5DAC3|nr:hypothetical protein [Sphingomonas sp.]